MRFFSPVQADKVNNRRTRTCVNHAKTLPVYVSNTVYITFIKIFKKLYFLWHNKAVMLIVEGSGVNMGEQDRQENLINCYLNALCCCHSEFHGDHHLFRVLTFT